ncbi:MAG TPA: signal peptidase I [Nocardioides sp.]|uniref:signal peptidase I n=1 Tax=Nocardioides sp. TaxID=35761 RepID=UPI002EDA1AAF
MVLFLLGLLLAVIALTFSVEVSGSSMEPTLHPGDRLEVDVLHRKDINRFDLVEAAEPDNGAAIVKRVIGLPGDQVKIRSGDEGARVLVRPSGSRSTYVVDNPAWGDQLAHDAAVCCTADGTNGQEEWATIPDGSYWLLGDNWSRSTDSRSFGFVTQGGVKAKLWFRILPRDRFGRVRTDARLVRTAQAD